jgi:acetolactate synthase I/II/III large subunit
MKLSDYVARFVAERRVTHVFGVSGGASLHLIESFGTTAGVEFVCPAHEQGGAMAADGFARASRGPGVAVATSGPGATNLLTGICCSYYDSVPVLFLTGQVASFRMKGDLGVRQIGFQETDIVDICRPVTKYAVRLSDPARIRYELEKAWHLALEGRPGPVLVDIPDDMQRESVEPEDMESYSVPPTLTSTADSHFSELLDLMEGAERPVLILGWGIRLANADALVSEFVERLGFPVAPTWAVADILPADHPLLVGTFGTHGTRYGNFTVQNADFVISVGARLDTKATGSPMTSFARGARKVVVDKDQSELGKFRHFGLEVDLLIQADAADFIETGIEALTRRSPPKYREWKDIIRQWKAAYPSCLPAYYEEESINPYVLMRALSKACLPGDQIVVDTGCAIAWAMQAFEFKEGQRLFHDFNNTAMGWSLPASIGVSLAMDRRSVICVIGDGSLMMSVQELATVVRHQLPIKILLLNNSGYSMIRQTQDQWLQGHYLASSIEGGLADVDFPSVAQGFGLDVCTLSHARDIGEMISSLLESPGPMLCNVEIEPNQRVVPQTKFGRPNEDMEPLLPRDEYRSCMIVPPIDCS